jgi:hypothetical protein
LLADPLGDGPQTTAGATGQDDSTHGGRILFSRWPEGNPQYSMRTSRSANPE